VSTIEVLDMGCKSGSKTDVTLRQRYLYPFVCKVLSCAFFAELGIPAMPDLRRQIFSFWWNLVCPKRRKLGRSYRPFLELLSALDYQLVT